MGDNFGLELEHIPLCVIDKDFNIIRVSTTLASLLQVKKDEIIGKKCYNTISGQFCNTPQCTLKQILGGKECWKYEKEIKLSNGIMITCIMRAVPHGTDNEVINILQNYTDITRYKKFEEQLKNSEEKYRHLFEKSPYMIILITSQGKIVDFNQTTYKYLIGYDKKELIGRNFLELNFIPPRHLKILKELYDELLIKGYTESFEFYMDTEKSIIKGTNLKWIELQASLVKVEEKKLIQVIIKDITAKKEAEQKLKQSEEKYRLISENARDIIGVLNKKFELEYINEKALFNIGGYKVEEVIGKSGLQFVHPDDLGRTIKSLNKGRIEGQDKIDIRFKHKDGHYIWFEATGKIFIDSNGETKGTIVLRDISDRKLAENKLKESEEKYRLISENANDIITVQDGRFRIEYINEHALKRVLGYSKEDLIGRSAIRFAHPDDQERILQTFMKIFKEREAFSEGRLKCKDGSYIWAEFNGQLFFDEKRQPKFLLITRDITERKQLEKHIKRENERLKQLDKIRKDFLDIASHELKSPLTYISGAFQLLDKFHKEKLSKDVLNLVEIAKQGVMRLQNLVLNLLDISRIESQGIELKLEKIDLVSLINICTLELKPQLENREHILHLDMPSHVYLNLDKFGFERVITNILSNAIKYSPPRSNIYIKLEEKENVVEFSIRDEGFGLTEEELKNLFQKFNRLDKLRENLVTDIEGSGLGLYISRKIVELHGGKIWAESEGRHKGSTFKVIIPKF